MAEVPEIPDGDEAAAPNQGPRDLTAAALSKIHQKYGREIGLNPALLRSLLFEELGDERRFKRQVGALAAASEAGVVARLLFESGQPDDEEGEITSGGASQGDARWAIAIWTETLAQPGSAQPSRAPVAAKKKQRQRPRPTGGAPRRRSRRRLRKWAPMVLGALSLALIVVLGLLAWNAYDTRTLDGRTPVQPGPAGENTSVGDRAQPNATTPGSQRIPSGDAETQDLDETALGGPEVPAAEPDSVNRPREGTYVYGYSGRSTTPPDPDPRSFNGTQRLSLSRQGDIYTHRQTDSERSGTSTTRVRWSENGTELMSMAVSVPDASSFECSFDPALRVIPFPLGAGTVPTQSLQGSGNFCDGSLDVDVVETTAQDAGGRSWSVWEIKVHLRASGDNYSLDQTTTRWFSPDLGVDVRSESATISEVQTGPVTVTANTESASVLRSWP